VIRVSKVGSMRSPVIIIGQFAFKLARNRRGRASNLYEADLYRSVNATRRALLCPVLWVSRNGAVQIMRAAKPLNDMMSLAEYMELLKSGTKCRERIAVPSNQRHMTGYGSRVAWSHLIIRLLPGRPTKLVPLETLERALPGQPCRGDVPIFHVGRE
jgi:hypothetical protein